MFYAAYAGIIEALERPDRSRADGGDFLAGLQQVLEESEAYDERLPVHWVLAYQRTFHRKECPRAHMEADVLHVDSARGDRAEHLVREMQACRGRRYRTPYMGVERLVSFKVNIFRPAVQIGRYRNLAA